MNGCEQFLTILAQNGLTAWPDFGTLLGLARHRNVIPWDYDADYCMLRPDYERLLQVFARKGGIIGTLRLEPGYYNDSDGCCCILFTDWPDDSLGIDIVAYARTETMLVNQMSPASLARYPGTYDFDYRTVFPLKRRWFLGQHTWAPNLIEERLSEYFGSTWRAYPDGHIESDLTAPPFREIDSMPAGSIVWRNQQADPITAWIVPAEARAGMNLSEETFRTISFTDLVFVEERKLWGRVFVGLLQPGKSVSMASGSWIRVQDLS